MPFPLAVTAILQPSFTTPIAPALYRQDYSQLFFLLNLEELATQPLQVWFWTSGAGSLPTQRTPVRRI
jgi:hypothetical protein